MEGQTLPATLTPKLQSITLNVSNGKQPGMWSAENLACLGIELTPKTCSVAIEADAAIVDLHHLHKILAESGLLDRVCSLNQQCWGVKGPPAHFGMDIEVCLQENISSHRKIFLRSADAANAIRFLFHFV